VGGSLIPLPYPYIVPGGRFQEIYYWDSYFTMLGLSVSGRFDLIENMVDNSLFSSRHWGIFQTAIELIISVVRNHHFSP
jgi:alpha,alpha-trehalase